MSVEHAAPGRASLWAHAEFMRLWAAQTISLFGSQFTQLALPIVAAQMLGASPAEMGYLAALATAPFLLFGIFAGVWVDRVPRRPVLIATDIGRALVLAVIPVAILTGTLRIELLYVTEFVVGVLTVFFEVAYQAYLPSLVGRAQLVEGNSKLESSRSVAQIVGPGLAGAIVQWFGAWIAVTLDALSFLASGAFLGLIRTPEPRPERTQRASMIAEAREGLAVVFGNRLLWSIAGCTGTANFFGSAAFALYILFATRDLGLSAGAIGAIFSVGSVSGLAGAMTAARIARRFGVGRVIVWSSLISGLGLIPVALATPSSAFPLLVAGGLMFSFAVPVYNINQVSLRQAIVPLRLQGRLNATMRFLVWGTMPLGGLAGGFLGEHLGVRPAITLAAAGALTAFLWVFLSPVRRLERIPEPEG